MTVPLGMSEGMLSLRLGGFELLFNVFGTTLFGVTMLALLSPDPYATALQISVLIGYNSGFFFVDTEPFIVSAVGRAV